MLDLLRNFFDDDDDDDDDDEDEDDEDEGICSNIFTFHFQ